MRSRSFWETQVASGDGDWELGRAHWEAPGLARGALGTSFGSPGGRFSTLLEVLSGSESEKVRYAEFAIPSM